MKKLFLLVAIVAASLSGMSQVFSVKQDVKDYINAKIIPNSTHAITPDVMKKILLGLWEFNEDSTWLSGTSIKYRRGSLVFTIPFTTSSGLSDTSFLHKGLTENVWGVKNFLNLTTVLAPSLSDSSNKIPSTAWVRQYIATHGLTETDPVWTAASANYYTKTQSDALFVPLTRNITINSVTHDLSIDRSWTIPAVDTLPLHNQIITKLNAGKQLISLSWAGNDSVHVLVAHFADGTSVQSSVFDRGSGGGGSGSSFDTTYIYHYIDSLNASIVETDPVWISDSSNFYTKAEANDIYATKEPVIIAPYLAGKYWNGFKNYVSFNTDSIPAGSINKYDQTVSISNGGNILVTGTYPNFTLKADTTHSPTHLASKYYVDSVKASISTPTLQEVLSVGNVVSSGHMNFNDGSNIILDADGTGNAKITGGFNGTATISMTTTGGANWADLKFPITAGRLFTFPDASGTIALTSDITTAIAGYVPTTRTITINGTAFDLSANRSWSVGTVTSVATGFGLSGGTITGTGTVVFDSTAGGGFHTKPFNDLTYYPLSSNPAHYLTTATDTTGSPVFIVAASNAPAALKKRADYVCDGTADEVEIKAALLLGNVTLTEGTYSITSGILIPSNRTLSGTGKGTKLLASGMATGFGGTADSSSVMIGNSGSEGITVRNMSIDGNVNTSWGILFSSVGSQGGDTAIAGTTIENVYINNIGSSAIELRNCWNNLINHNTITKAYQDGITLTRTSGTDSTKRTIVSNNVINGGFAAVFLTYASNTIVEGNLCDGQVDLSIQGENSNRVSIVNNTVTNGYTSNIFFTDCNVVTIDGNTIDGNRGSGGLIELYTCPGAIISNNKVLNGRRYGIYVDGGTNSVISGNYVAFNSSSSNNAYPGILITGASADVEVTGNNIKRGSGNQQNYGLQISSNSPRALVHGNDFYLSGATDDILNSAATTRVRNNVANAGTWKDLLITAYQVEMNTNKILGRTTASQGGIEEISIGSNLNFATGILSFDSSSSATGYHTQPYNDLRYLKISDTTNKWVQNVTKNVTNDSIYVWKNGTYTALSTGGAETDPLSIHLTGTSTLTGNATVATASNTLTISTSTASINPLTVTAGTGKAAIISSSGGNATVDVTNSSSGSGIAVTTTGGIGINITSTNGTALGALSTNSTGAEIGINPSSTNTADEVLRIYRKTSGTAANNIGASIDFYNPTSTASISFSGNIINKVTDITHATRTTQWDIKGVNSAVTENFLNIQHDLIRFNNNTDTVASKAYARSVGGAGGGYTDLTQFVAQTNWRLFYSNGSGDVTELALGASGTYLKSNGTTSAPSFDTPGGVSDGDKGDIVVSSSGTVWDIDAGVIVDADINASAAIAYSKLNLATSIVNADISASAAIAYSKLNLTGAILNADLAGSIAYSKLSLTGAILNADLAGSINATKINTGVVDNTEFNYLDGVTSGIQGQLNNLQTLATTVTGLTAAGTNQGTALALSGSYSLQEITTAASGTGVQLPVATTSSRVTVVNRGANAIVVYPATSGIINGQSANLGYTLPANGVMTFIGKSSTSWYSSSSFQNGDVNTTDANGTLIIGAGKVTNAMLAGSISNANLANSTVTVNGTSIALGASGTVTAAAGTLTGATLNSTVTASSLTSVASLTSLTMAGDIALGANNLTITGSIGATGSRSTKGWFTNLEISNMPTVGGTSLSSTFAPIASPTFTGTVTLPASTSFTTPVLGAATGTSLVLSSFLNEAKGADIASATTTDIGAATGNYLDVTGTVTITGLGTVQAGTRRIVRFTGALTLTHNSTSLILPGAANITTVAGDVATFMSLGSGNWRCISYTKTTVTGTGSTVLSASPTFTGTVTFPTSFVLGATTVTTTGTQLNYLNAATGTTGTTSTNLVYSTSPTLVTPALGTPSALVATNITGIPSLNKAISLAAPTSSETIDFFYSAAAITVTEVREVLRGSSPSVTYTINYGSSPTSATSTIVASHAATSTSGTAATLNVTSIPAGSYIWITTSATSGTVTNFAFTMTYTQ